MDTLLESITKILIAPAIKNKWFSDPVVPFRRYLGLYQEAFETGIVLGYAYRDDLLCLVKLFCQKGRESELAGFLQELAQVSLSELPDAKNFLDFGIYAEEKRCKSEICKQSDNGRGIFTLSEEKLDEMTNQFEIPVPVAYRNIQTTMSLAIGFGSSFPEITEQLWKNQYEHISQDDVDFMRATGLQIPANIILPSPTLAQRTAEVRTLLEEFVRRSRPELLNEFRISGC